MQFKNLSVSAKSVTSCVIWGDKPIIFKFWVRGDRTSILESWPSSSRNLAEKPPVLVNAAVTYSKPGLATFWHYARVELVPLTAAEIPTAIQSLKKIVKSAQTGSFKQLTVKEALLNGLVATEVWMWFYVSEIIGRCGIIGYNV
ncbi:ATP synthase subunit g, mitochondrial-like [Canis lupus familiaris]|uniref:ATP synthase subunit g, mitochondrial-like n=1 Tax=Canis lupus familiaris TaxID=9615 RepID=UPI0018F69AA6|nr:ATP synthase subunit g, mitochondrial-like [Canis lupus familiaris]